MRLDKMLDIFKKVFKAHCFASLSLLALLFFQKGEIFSRIFIVLFLSISGFILITEKLTIKALLSTVRRKGLNYRNILIIGTGMSALQATKLIEEYPEIGWRIIGYLMTRDIPLDSQIPQDKIIGNLTDLKRILEVKEIDEVIFTEAPTHFENFNELLWSCEEVGIKARLISDYFVLKFAKVVSDDFFGIPSLIFVSTPLNLTHLAVKRAFDMIGSICLLILFMPVLALIALAIKIDSPGPVFFRQVRMGVNGRQFQCLKFRSMVANAESIRDSLLSLNEQSGPVFKIKNDPRITRVGRILRKYSLDELPQLFNILKGDMSFVGIRPPLPSEVEQYDRWQRRRLSMKPGVTCLWQINGRNKVSFEEWMKMDLAYIDNWSLKLDFSILLKTIPAVLRGTGQ
jgi:exopolysaccharide biosynthesis polyprenyl glycosylphosphotransferase